MTHVFARSGHYAVLLTVTDDLGTSATATCSVNVDPDPGNLAPVAIIASGPRACTAPCTLSFDGSLSTDPNLDAMEFRWEFRLDGETCATGADCPVEFLCLSRICAKTDEGRRIEQRFEKAGTYTVQLSVIDAGGLVGNAGPELIQITESGVAPSEPGTAQPVPGGGELANSASQRRPGMGLCGFGMITSFLGSLLGLSAMATMRRRFRL